MGVAQDNARIDRQSLSPAGGAAARRLQELGRDPLLQVRHADNRRREHSLSLIILSPEVIDNFSGKEKKNRENLT